MCAFVIHQNLISFLFLKRTDLCFPSSNKKAGKLGHFNNQRYFTRGLQDYQHSRIPLWVTFHSNGLNQAPVRMRGESANSSLLTCDYTRYGTLQDVTVNSSPATHNNRDILDLSAVLIVSWKLETVQIFGEM